ncbi:MAG: T9SS type A sorting domain-containing protein [Saprospiraceae bacterium]
MQPSNAKLFLLLLSFFLFPTLHAQSLNWYILQTNCTSYEQSREMVLSLDNENRLFSLVYSPQYLVFASNENAALEHPYLVRQMNLQDVVQATNLPKVLSTFFIALFQEEERYEAPAHPHKAEACLASNDLEKDKTEFNYANRWNSERMAGIMTCNVLFVESDGTEDPDYFTWPAAALFKEKTTILKALNTWAYTAFLEGVDVTFVPQWFERTAALGQGKEPNLHFGSFNTFAAEVLKMNTQILAQLGYTQENFAADEFNYHYKRQTAADGAFTMGVHYNHEGRGLIRPHAYLGGPNTFLNSDTHFSVYGHEIGHIFHAFDEYNNPDCQFNNYTTFNGIINENNIGNGCLGKQSCLMDNNATIGAGPSTRYALCDYTKAHLGWAGDIPSQPKILSPSQDTSFSLFLQPFTFYFPPTSGELKSATIKIWQQRDGEPQLVFSETIKLTADTLIWRNEAIHQAGSYTMVVQHGEASRFALVDSAPLHFSIEEHARLPFADTCIWYCGNLEALNLGIDMVKWYDKPELDIPIHTGPDFTPASSGLYYMALEEDGIIKDVAKVQITANFPVSAQLLQTFSTNGPSSLYLQSFTGIPHVRAFHWYRNDTLIATNQTPFLEVTQEANYYVVIDNGCQSITNALQWQAPPLISYTQDCEDGSYLIRANKLIGIRNETTQVFTISDSLRITTAGEAIEITIYSPDQAIVWGSYALASLPTEGFRLENIDGFLRFKAETLENISWYRNDTLLLRGSQNWLTPQRPGTYWATYQQVGAFCPLISDKIELFDFTPPPSAAANSYTACLLEDMETPTIAIEGQNIRWYLEPQKEELIAEGNTFQPSLDYFSFNAQLHITQTINGVESPPLRVDLIGQKPLLASLDTFDQAFLAIVNGIQVNLEPKDYLYEWAYNTQFLASTFTPSYPIGDPGTYAVSVSNQEPACLHSEPFILEGMVSSIEEEEWLVEKVRAYPNPTQQVLTIQTSHTPIQFIQIYNLSGQIVKQQQGHFQNKVVLDLNTLLPGVYVVLINADRENLSPVKFVKE